VRQRDVKPAENDAVGFTAICDKRTDQERMT